MSAAKFYGDGDPSEDQDIEKELDWLIEKEEKKASKDQVSADDDNVENDATEEEIDKLLAEDDDEEEKGQAETAGSGKEENGSGEPATAKSELSNQNTAKTSPPSSEVGGASEGQEAASSSAGIGGHSRTEQMPSPQNRDEDSDDYTLTDDQRQAMAELDNMKSDADYDYLNEDPPPEYDVTERIKQLNAELEYDGVPTDMDREKKVGFKDNLVDLVAPPPVFSDDEEEIQKETNQENESGDREQDNAGDNQGTSKDKDSKVLVEREGKFELVDSDDALAAGYGGGPPLAQVSGSSLSPAPPSQPRPSTANGYNRQQRFQPNRRAQSAQVSSNRNEDDWSSSYKSPYGLSDAQKAIKVERDKALQRRQRTEAERKKEEENEKRQENEEAFKAWLNRKRDEAAQRRHQEKVEEGSKEKKSESSETGSTSSSQEERDNESAFKEWLQVKAKQKQEEKETEREKTKELQDGYYLRSRKECDKAFRAWLKKKNTEQRSSRENKRKKQSIAMLYLRRSRKSQALAKAIQYSQSFRYVDYYGYRM